MKPPWAVLLRCLSVPCAQAAPTRACTASCRWCTLMPRWIAPPRRGCAVPTPFSPPTSLCNGLGACPMPFMPVPVPQRGAMPMYCSSPRCAPASKPGVWAGCSARSMARPCVPRPRTCWVSMTSPRSAPRPAKHCHPSKRCGASTLPARAPPTRSRERTGAPATGALNSKPMPSCTT